LTNFNDNFAKQREKNVFQLYLALVLSIAITSCNPIQRIFNQGKRPYSDVTEGTRPYQNNEIVANEINFKGNPETVSAWMQQQGLTVEFQRIFDDSDYYTARYQGTNFKTYEEVEEGLKGQLEMVEPNHIVSLHASENVYDWPNDKNFFRQYSLNNIGQSAPYGLPGSKDSDINIMKVWEEGHKGSKDIIVAVIDTGVDYKHPDLRANMWFNDAERKGIPGEDDDGNGFCDDEYGYDFYSMGRKKLHCGQAGGPDPMDDSGHGTHCAGVIGAVADNGIGIAGINWNVRIMPVRFLGDGGGTSADGARSIDYAVKNGAHIISASWGGGGESDLVRTAISRANDAGVLFVAAAGNNSENNDIKAQASYPASYDLPNIISVGASDNQDAPAEFSNYGHRSVHVFAPGVLTLSTFPTHLAEEEKSEPYIVYSGTSMATPHVAGIAALLMSARPELVGNPETLKNLLIATSDVQPQLVGKSQSNGRVNAYAALKAPLDKVSINPEWTELSYPINRSGYNEELFDIRETIKVPEAKAVRVHFEFIDIEEPFDSIYLYDKNLRLISQIEEVQSTSHWSSIIPGNEVLIRYVNSKVKAPQFETASFDSREACYFVGGLNPEIDKNGKYTCQVDKMSSNDSDVYNNFGSQGYRIDKVEYLPL
jgi:subtilisin family serine protease